MNATCRLIVLRKFIENEIRREPFIAQLDPPSGLSQLKLSIFCARKSIRKVIHSEVYMTTPLYLQILQVLLSGSTLASFLFSSNAHFYRKTCRLQRDMNSDCQSRMRASLPLDHKHGPNSTVLGWPMNIRVKLFTYLLPSTSCVVIS